MSCFRHLPHIGFQKQNIGVDRICFKSNSLAIEIVLHVLQLAIQCEDVILDEMKCFKMTPLVLAITAEDRGWHRSL